MSPRFLLSALLLLLLTFDHTLIAKPTEFKALSKPTVILKKLSYLQEPSATKVVRIKINNPSVPKESEALRFYVQGGLHANEKLTTQFVNWLEGRLSRGESPLNNLPHHSEFDLVAAAIPEPNQARRYNSNQVNLNRNFSVLWGVSNEPAGDRPFSEPETRSIRDLFHTRDYLAAVDVHGYLNWIVGPSKPELIGRKKPEQRTRYKVWTDALREAARSLPEYEYKKAGELGDGGSFEDWAYWEQNTFAFCLEMEKPQRFIQQKDPRKVYDSFLAYENVIFDMFSKAIEIQKSEDQGEGDNSIATRPTKVKRSKQKSH